MCMKSIVKYKLIIALPGCVGGLFYKKSQTLSIFQILDLNASNFEITMKPFLEPLLKFHIVFFLNLKLGYFKNKAVLHFKKKAVLHCVHEKNICFFCQL